jgi:hypothetical protein
MVVLATKLYVGGDARERALDSLSAQVENSLGDLEVEWSVGVRDDGFPSVTVEGADAPVARNLLREEWGTITPHREPGEVYVGTLERWDEDGFYLDAGEEVFVPTDGLGLGPGTPSQVRRRFGLVQHVPLRFVVDDGAARLADEERDRLYGWTRGEGRVNVNSATRSEVRATLNRAGHAEDVVTVERLGLLEQSIVCREGTDPPGLIASIGRYLPSELLAVVP